MIKTNIYRKNFYSPNYISNLKQFSERSNKLSNFFTFQRFTSRKVATMSIFGMGVPEIVLIAGVAALVFGPSKLPELAKTLGKSAKSLQSAAKEFEKELKSATSDELITTNQNDNPEKYD